MAHHVLEVGLVLVPRVCADGGRVAVEGADAACEAVAVDLLEGRRRRRRRVGRVARLEIGPVPGEVDLGPQHPVEVALLDAHEARGRVARLGEVAAALRRQHLVPAIAQVLGESDPVLAALVVGPVADRRPLEPQLPVPLDDELPARHGGIERAQRVAADQEQPLALRLDDIALRPWVLRRDLRAKGPSRGWRDNEQLPFRQLAIQR